MANFPSLKKALTLEEVRNIREGFEITFIEELNGPDWRGYYTTYSFPDFGLSWTNQSEHNLAKQEFINYSFAITGEKEPKEIDKKLLDIEQNLAKNPGQVYKVTPTQEAIQRGEKLAEEQKIELAKSEAAAKEGVQKFIKTQEKLRPKPSKVPKATGPVSAATQPAATIEATLPMTPTTKVEAEVLQEVSLEKDKNITDQLKGQKVVVVPTEKLQTVTLTSEEKKQIFNLAQAAKTDPETTEKIIEQKIQESVDKSSPEVKENITKPIVTRAATDLVEKVKPFAVYDNPSEIPDTIPVLNPVSPLISISNPDDPNLKKLIPNNEARTELARNVQALSLAIEAENNINQGLTGPLFEGTENISGVFYPQQITQFQIAKNQEDKEEGIEIDPEDIYHKGKKVRELWQNLANKTTTVDNVITTTAIIPYTPVTITTTSEATSFVTVALPTTVGAVTGFGAGSALTSYYVTQSLPLLAGEGLPFFITQTPAPTFTLSAWTMTSAPAEAVAYRMFVGGAEVPITLPSNMTIFTAAEGAAPKVVAAGQVAKKGLAGLNIKLGNAVAIGASKIAAKLGFTAASAKILATVGTGLAGPIGTIAGLIISALFGKLIEKISPWIKKHQEDLKITGGLLLGGGIILNSIPMAIIGGLIFTPIAIKTGFSLVRMASRTAFFFGKIGASMAITIATPLIVILIVFPILVAIILFIINSGAYIVPPQLSSIPGAGGGENANISVTKTATPSCRNSTKTGCVSGFPDVTYTVTITAKKGVLTNIRFSNLYSVVGGSVAAPTPNIDEINNPPESISPSSDYIITYTISLGSEYNNTVVVDTFSVTADSADQPGTSVSTNASVITGDPPIDCPIIGGVVGFGSYTPGNENEKTHGSNYYWDQSGVAKCEWPLPSVAGCYGPSDPRATLNYCKTDARGTCSYYGAAIDVFAAAGAPVYMPRVLGQNLTWSCGYSYANGGGTAGHTYACSSGQYTLIFTHLMNNGRTGTINSGEKFGELYPLGGGPHVHIEFVINGQYVRPEEYFCSI
jgi:hypothetical protein